jgi:PAS domain-containing protein
VGQPQHDIEVILTRELASSLATPVFLIDPAGSLLFYNEAAEAILGRRFDETGEMSASEWSTAFVPTDEEGHLIPQEDLPLGIALRDRRPAHKRFSMRGLDGTRHEIEASAFPLIGQAGRLVGAVAFFWKAGDR